MEYWVRKGKAKTRPPAFNSTKFPFFQPKMQNLNCKLQQIKRTVNTGEGKSQGEIRFALCARRFRFCSSPLTPHDSRPAAFNMVRIFLFITFCLLLAIGLGSCSGGGSSSGSGGAQSPTAWAKAYGGGNKDVARSIQQTSDGGFIVAGETASFGAVNSHVWVLKLERQRKDPVGEDLWRKRP